MNSNVLLFPKISKTKFVRSRRRVFSIGMRYVGPALCQELQEVFIKRCGDGLWNLQFYYQGRAWVIERSESEDLPDARAGSFVRNAVAERHQFYSSLDLCFPYS